MKDNDSEMSFGYVWGSAPGENQEMYLSWMCFIRESKFLCGFITPYSFRFSRNGWVWNICSLATEAMLWETFQAYKICSCSLHTEMFSILVPTCGVELFPGHSCWTGGFILSQHGRRSFSTDLCSMSSFAVNRNCPFIHSYATGNCKFGVTVVSS